MTPVDTFAVVVPEVTGTCHVPNVFGDDVRVLLASLDWARVFNTSQDHAATAGELNTAATAARAIADQCDRFAATAREIL